MAVDKLQEEKGMALADFLHDFHEAPFELIHGKRQLWIPHLAGQTMIIHTVDRYLNSFGEVFLGATIIQEIARGLLLSVFRPDIVLFLPEHLETYLTENPDWKDSPFALIPDLIVEVVSKNDSYSEINEKVGAYLEAGVKEIWVIDPQAKNAFVHSAEKSQMHKKEESIRGTVLPNFELKLSDLFGEKA